MKSNMRKNLVLIFISVIMGAYFSANAAAQVRPVDDYGAMGLGQLLKRLNTTASVMMIGAHPDDEDSALLAYLARGENARTAYLSLTRGDGGQNIIGHELFESLGVIRTEELLQARRLDGAKQYFTRAFDYGFSKTLAEAKSKWPEDVIKCDVVRAIRLFRPLVVISRFSGTPADGHGQHQYAGYITPLAVKAAADPKQCTDTGEAWQVLKYYMEQGFGASDTAALKLNTGAYDPILGRSYFEIAMEGRSQHRSQGDGRIEFHGDQFSGLNLIDSKVAKVEKETSPFDGIDTSLTGLSKLFSNNSPMASEVDSSLYGAQRAVEQAVKEYDVQNPAKLVPILLNGRKALGELLASPDARPAPAAIPIIYTEYRRFDKAIGVALGVQIDALAQTETVIPGEEIATAVKVYFPKTSGVMVKDITLKTATGWEVTKTEAPKDNTQAFFRETANTSAFFNLKVPANAKPTQPYWLEDKRSGDLFAWSKDNNQTLPFAGQLVTAEVKVEINGTDVTLTQPVQYRFADPSRGEIRREVNVVPVLSVAVDRDLVIVPASDKPQVRRVVVSVTNNTPREQTGNVLLNIAVSPEWKVALPSGSNFSLKTKGAKASIPFDITIPVRTAVGSIPIRASSEVGQARYATTMSTVAYPHIQTHRYYTPADVDVKVMDLKTVPVKAGYIMGSGDEVLEAIRQMGFDVTMLEEKDLTSGDLSKYDTIVVGIRASETRPDLVANNQRLLDYTKNGGNVIVQYQRGNWIGLAPYPVSINDTQKTTAGSIARVVDQNAKVTILQPDSPVFNSPNKITDADFAGWVQERNAYNLVTFDAEYTPLLESHDAAEQENKGGLVIAKVGKGNWIYCSYSMFRQLPAGVPGAYRLFANLLSLPKGK